MTKWISADTGKTIIMKNSRFASPVLFLANIESVLLYDSIHEMTYICTESASRQRRNRFRKTLEICLLLMCGNEKLKLLFDNLL